MKKEKSKEIAKKRLNKILIKDRALTRSSKAIAKAMIATGMFSMISCSGVVTFASTEGIRAQNEGNIGLVEQVKGSPDKKTAYWENQNYYSSKKSWIEGVFKGAK